MSNDKFGDERLKKTSGADSRASRDNADMTRVQQDGTTLSAEERRRLLRQDWVSEILPTAPNLEGFHTCWLSTTNSTDPVYKRIQRGYTPVKSSEVPGLGSQFTVSGGEFEGCVARNEMLLFKIPVQLYNDLMAIYHHDMPNEMEQSIYERVNSMNQQDSSGRALGEVEGDFANMGRSRGPTPTFA